jgi:alkanesulfonate monooxygenase
MHPYTVAKLVSSFGYLFGRRMYLNMVAGGFKNDLVALNDLTPHDKRYERLIEYTKIIKSLLADQNPNTFLGEFYKVNNLRMTPLLAEGLFPGILISGSSQAGLSAARCLGAVPILYAKPAKDFESAPVNTGTNFGIRLGVMARPTEQEAWKEARERFPEDKKGKMIHELAMKISDSSWHHELSNAVEENKGTATSYWLTPFENYKTFCPYLVGSYEQVAEELACYMALGCRTFILDVPVCEEDLQQARVAIDLACNKTHIAEGDRSTLPAAPALVMPKRPLQSSGWVEDKRA